MDLITVGGFKSHWCVTDIWCLMRVLQGHESLASWYSQGNSHGTFHPLLSLYSWINPPAKALYQAYWKCSREEYYATMRKVLLQIYTLYAKEEEIIYVPKLTYLSCQRRWAVSLRPLEGAIDLHLIISCLCHSTVIEFLRRLYHLYVMWVIFLIYLDVFQLMNVIRSLWNQY